ncbi:DUF3618 domain-containing protein [Thalassiella azotivora]
MGEDTQRLTHDIEGTRHDLTRDVDALSDRVSPSRVVERRKQAARSSLGSLRDRVMGSANDAGHSAGGTASSVRGRAGDVASGASDAASGAVDTARERTEGNPLAAGLIAFGVGWLVSSLLPASEKEQRLASRAEEAAREHAAPLADEAKQVGRDVGEQMKDKASHAADEVRSTAQEGAQRVTQEGRSSKQTVTEETRDQGSSVRDRAGG